MEILSPLGRVELERIKDGLLWLSWDNYYRNLEVSVTLAPRIGNETKCYVVCL